MESRDAAGSQRPRILVVEDDEDLLESETRLLTRAGFDVLSALDGETALKILDSSVLDIVLTDLRLPGISGIHVLRAAREKQPSVKVYILTAYVDERVREEASSLGAAGFLTKPVTRSQLLEALGTPR